MAKHSSNRQKRLHEYQMYKNDYILTDDDYMNVLFPISSEIFTVRLLTQ